MTEPAQPMPWVVFEKKKRSNSVIVVDASFPNARKRGAIRLRLRETDVDYAPVIAGESVKAAKSRVAGAVR
jgi:hypothetical protein